MDNICHVYEYEDISAPGEMPKKKLVEQFRAWYAEIEYSNDYLQSSGQPNMAQIDARIRVHQDKRITIQSIVRLDEGKYYRVARVYHGLDGYDIPITDINLSKIEEDVNGGS